ncbi:hypothetical protein LPB72_03430 [Hydrogenophaga crassostreae]|uniref:Uncharacterized protein n=1 Tax=Hydrogenophaga crassostreae TaxID=1763535 RepID=A0A167IU56_9BURK|nr:hypothetical protein LPB072_17605 [Hydrogenophaga crassostreae]OAD43594.1 hypothetical protein LPB72_03430 [Hydrogenophaga crassostreae]
MPTVRRLPYKVNQRGLVPGGQAPIELNAPVMPSLWPVKSAQVKRARISIPLLGEARAAAHR